MVFQYMYSHIIKKKIKPEILYQPKKKEIKDSLIQGLSKKVYFIFIVDGIKGRQCKLDVDGFFYLILH